MSPAVRCVRARARMRRGRTASASAACVTAASSIWFSSMSVREVKRSPRREAVRGDDICPPQPVVRGGGEGREGREGRGKRDEGGSRGVRGASAGASAGGSACVGRAWHVVVVVAERGGRVPARQGVKATHAQGKGGGKSRSRKGRVAREEKEEGRADTPPLEEQVTHTPPKNGFQCRPRDSRAETRGVSKWQSCEDLGSLSC